MYQGQNIMNVTVLHLFTKTVLKSNEEQESQRKEQITVDHG